MFIGNGGKHVLRYLRGSKDFGLMLYKSSHLDLLGYTDVDCAGYTDDRR